MAKTGSTSSSQKKKAGGAARQTQLFSFFSKAPLSTPAKKKLDSSTTTTSSKPKAAASKANQTPSVLTSPKETKKIVVGTPSTVGTEEDREKERQNEGEGEAEEEEEEEEEAEADKEEEEEAEEPVCVVDETKTKDEEGRENPEIVSAAAAKTTAKDDGNQTVKAKTITAKKKKKSKYPIGTTVEKNFEGHGMFKGTVKSMDQDFYHVVYEDEEEEDYTESELDDIVIVANNESEPKLPDTKTAASTTRKTTITRSTKQKRRIIEEDPESENEMEVEEAEEEFDDDDDDDDDDDNDNDNDNEPPAKKTKPSKEPTTKTKSQIKQTTKQKPVSRTTKEKPAEVEKMASSNKKNKAEGPTSKKSDGWGFMQWKEPPKKRTKKSPAGSVAAATSSAGRTTVKKAYTAGDDLPIISEPQAMFDDMVFNQLTGNGKDVGVLLPLLKKIQGRPLRIATMCSGTESPVLALDMLANSIEDFIHKHEGENPEFKGLKTIQIEHVFSCEIEPFKQAYIERNFQPPLLFRDIRELGKAQATTAYGSLADVPNTPGCVDLLIAGTSCVDYSNLNNEKKEIDGDGESGQTFRGMLDWMKKASPYMILLENVRGAPWDQKVKLLNAIGYHAAYVHVDTKQFYIPHTRLRGYLFAVRKETAPKKMQITSGTVQKWTDMMKQLQRPASAALDAFMLPNDDPRVLRGRARLSAGKNAEASGNAVDWTRCESRHQFARANEELGDQRPLTGWSDSGNTTMPGFAWNEWTNQQVHRIHDLMDVNTLRLAKEGIDPTYKSMIWNLSQNVDRDTMGKLGLSQCLTPTGVPYTTNRGGPLVGEELLLLQGIPADDLLLTKEAEDQLKDLAGNAMSTTVVGACMLGALVLAHHALPSRAIGMDCDDGKSLQSLVPRPLVPASGDIVITQAMGKYSTNSLRLDPLIPTITSRFFYEAHSSAQKCSSEGLDKVLPRGSILVCQECGHTSSQALATPPRKYEEHIFVAMEEGDRIEPAVFRQKLRTLLPMTFELRGLGPDLLELPPKVEKKVWEGWKTAVRNCNGTFRFKGEIRSRVWTALFETPDATSRIELRISNNEALWLLFAKAPAERGALRCCLENPVARMCVRKPNIDVEIPICNGEWKLCLPVISTVELEISGAGELIPSWRSNLGLKGAFESENQYEKLRIKLRSTGLDDLDDIVSGEYQNLPRCGGACGSLHKRVKASSSGNVGSMHFFLESGRCTLASDDSFVFSPDHGRISYGEYREIILKVNTNYRPWFQGTSDCAELKVVKADVQGQWTNMDSVSLDFSAGHNSQVEGPSNGSTLSVSMKNSGFKQCPEILSCDVPLKKTDALFMRCIRENSDAPVPMEVNLRKSKRLFESLAFITSRLSIPESVSGSWLPLASSDSQTFDGELCKTCSPPLPQLRWTAVTQGNRQKYAPVEDGREASVYEQARKKRPQPWMVQLQAAQNSNVADLKLRIGCNAVSLVNRALGLFPSTLARESCLKERFTFEWRIEPHIEKQSGSFPTLAFTSNKETRAAHQPPHFSKYQLRPEQLRSLSWMLSQEAATDPFLEEEVCEDLLPTLNWRAEGRVRRPVLVRGGIIADEVGYGKTAITLGVIDAAPNVNGAPPVPPESLRQGFITTKATLVIVPGHLMGQWPKEIKKFLGNSKIVVVIKNMAGFNKVTVKELQEADIVVVSFNVLSNDNYFSRLARLAGANPKSLPLGGKCGGRHFDAVYKECLAGLTPRVAQMKVDCSSVFQSVEDDAYEHATKKVNSIRLDGKKAVYKKVSEEQTKEERIDKIELLAAKGTLRPTSKCQLRKDGVNDQLSKADRDPWGLFNQKEVNKMKCPPLEMFFWRRLVVDEFHYLEEKKDRARVLTLVLGVKSSFRWCLSGTPPHENFIDAQCLANLLGLHLGVYETLPGMKRSRRGNSDERSGLEKLNTFLEQRSIQWHETRHSLAQEFLDRFVRQNIAEIDEIKCEEHLEKIGLPSGERAIYLELETYLKSLEAIKGKKSTRSALKSKKSAKGDREVRMQRVLEDSSTAEEALVKCASHFSMSSDVKTATQACDSLVDIRKQQLDECEEELCESIVRALRQRICVLDLQPDWEGCDGKMKGEVQDRLEMFLNDAEGKQSVSGGADNEVHERIINIVQKAKNTVEQSPKEYDKKFAEVNTEDKRTSAELRYDMKYALREHMHTVRAGAKELCGRIRSLRYFDYVCKFQAETSIGCCGGRASCSTKTGTSALVTCKEAGVFSCCGHSGCLNCLRECADSQKCIDKTCSAQIKPAHIVPASALNSNQSDYSGGKYGAKLSAIVKKVKQLIENDDRVIVFVQFRDLKDKVAEVLEENGVRTLQVKGSVDQQIKALDVLQKERPAKADPRCLLLTMDDESSAGVNLTTCNHAMFVHPLVADTQQQYDAYETQAIGRIRRYGQTKTVHIWRYLAADTIDTEIYKERTANRLKMQAKKG